MLYYILIYNTWNWEGVLQSASFSRYTIVGDSGNSGKFETALAAQVKE